MHRRSFVRVLTAGGVALVFESRLAGCQEKPSAAYQAWSGPLPSLADEDVRLRIASYGLLAPSVANLQPWWISLKHSGILVALEPHRILPHADRDLHQTFVSHGAFLETLRLAAGEFGLAATVTTFPKGEPDSSADLDRPVARLDLAPKGPRDPLTEYVTRRRTNRRPFSDEAVSSAHLATMTAAAPPGVDVHWFSDPSSRRAIADAIIEATTTSLDDPEQYLETVSTLRWSNHETESTRDGIPLEHLGLTAWAVWYERLVRSHAAIAEGAMRDRLVDMARRQATSAPAFGVVTTATRGRVAELAAGAALLRIHLAATSLGLAFQPLSAPLEGRTTLPPGLLPSRVTPHILFRVGYAAETPPSPRRTLFEVVQL